MLTNTDPTLNIHMHNPNVTVPASVGSSIGMGGAVAAGRVRTATVTGGGHLLLPV